MASIGEALVRGLEDRGVRVVFGIPGVHTIELYRGLARSRIRHITPRHEQGAGFMADGYARVSGREGVAFVITGPGLTNVVTPMAQARADSVPMLVISGVNDRASLGLGLGKLHELPDQQGLAEKVAGVSARIESGADLSHALDRAYAGFASRRPGPAHVEIPTDVMGLPCEPLESAGGRIDASAPTPAAGDVARAAELLAGASAPLILAGGGARLAELDLAEFARRLDAPVVLTTNARGLMHRHPLAVPASPSLESVRELIRGADAVLAVGTEIGATDYDMYANGGLPELSNLVRIDICRDQLERHPAAMTLCGRADTVLADLVTALPDGSGRKGSQRARTARDEALKELGPEMRAQLEILEAIRDAVPKAIIVGDSTQPIYAGNLYYDHDRPRGWFNAATGFGALGYAIPAAIGASLADPEAHVICLAGDGGAQFTLSDMLTAVDEKLPVTFLIWNNCGYREIEHSMRAAGVEAVGCDPTPPEFADVARAFRMPFRRCEMKPEALAGLLQDMPLDAGPSMIEIDVPDETTDRADP